MIFTKSDYVEYRAFPNVVWQVTGLRFNGGDPLIELKYVGSDDEKTLKRFLRKNGLAKLPSKLNTAYENLVEANAMLVLALESR